MLNDEAALGLRSSVRDEVAEVNVTASLRAPLGFSDPWNHLGPVAFAGFILGGTPQSAFDVFLRTVVILVLASISLAIFLTPTHCRCVPLNEITVWTSQDAWPARQ